MQGAVVRWKGRGAELEKPQLVQLGQPCMVRTWPVSGENWWFFARFKKGSLLGDGRLGRCVLRGFAFGLSFLQLSMRALVRKRKTFESTKNDTG